MAQQSPRRRFERDTTPSTPSRGKKARAPDSTGRFAHRNSKEYKADVAKGCEQFDDLQDFLEEHDAYRTVWKSNWRHFSIDATPARAWWCCSVMCVRVMCTCAPYWKTPSGAGKSVASSAFVCYMTRRRRDATPARWCGGVSSNSTEPASRRPVPRTSSCSRRDLCLEMVLSLR